MKSAPVELLLPLTESAGSDLTARRWHHLIDIPGVDARTAQRLARAFPSLSAVYSATEDQLVATVGPVAASRLRWFLDAPLDTGLSLHAVAAAHAA